ncbi:hypothetical protein Vafri_9246 [Volvox africanus]|uniref:Uncharacterized protein n=1 Tax=Volvox africanus TaxID=51714 RepID=A0A8J4B464_9CHLO|nr:hypothetical protein Vafri_9246 [Volvox africanus]
MTFAVFVMLLFLPVCLTQEESAQKTVLLPDDMVATAFKLALSPTHLNATHDGVQLHLNATTLLNTLMEIVESASVEQHWQGKRGDLQTLNELVRSGRALFLSSEKRHQQQQQQQQQRSLGSGELSSWLTVVERCTTAVQEGQSYPLFRRVVSALLLETWLAAGDSWSKAPDAVARRILLKLYDLHAASARRKSAVEYYHFSKAAGTSMCVTSAVVGCTTFSVKEQYTCLVPEFGDGPRWINRKAHNSRCRRVLPGFSQCLTKLYTKLAKWGLHYNNRSAVLGCEERAKWLSDRGFNFFASEYTLRGASGDVTAPPALCSGFLNLAVLRAPLSRIYSHMRYVVQTTYEWMGERTADYMANISLQDWRRLLPAAFDNYYIRGLLGEGGFYTKTGALNASAHLPAARGVIGAMDVILILEDPEALLQLGHGWGLGWPRTFTHAEGRSSIRLDKVVAKIVEKVVPRGEAAMELAAANSLDEQLYEFAVLLSRLDSVVWAVAEAAGLTPPAAAISSPDGDRRIVPFARAFSHSRSGGSNDRIPCGYVPPRWPKPPAPPMAPNATGGPPPTPLPDPAAGGK